MSQTQDHQLRERRNLVSLFMVTALLGLALQEAISPVREAVRALGVTVESSALFVAFFLTLFRFFIGNINHLQSEPLTNATSAFRWVFDSFVIIAECVLFIFLGGETTLAQNAVARYGFFELLVAILVLDVAWVLVMLLLSLIGRIKFLARGLRDALRRDAVPLRWAFLNAAMVVYIYFAGLPAQDHVLAANDLTIFIAVNAVAFVLDVVVFDYSNILGSRKR